MKRMLHHRKRKRKVMPYSALLLAGLVFATLHYFRLWKLFIPNIAKAYASAPIPAALQSQTEGQFSLLTYNIAGLPGILSSARTPRSPSIRSIGERLADYDIVNVQEDFNYNDELYEGDHHHPFRTRTMGLVPFSDGLNTLSKYPISGLQRITWHYRTGADKLTPKGFTFCRIEIARNIYLDLYNVHANAQDEPRPCWARRKNMMQLSHFIEENSRGNAIIIMGDMNSHYSYALDSAQILLHFNHFTDVWLELLRQNQLPTATAAFPDQDLLHLKNEEESIDKVLYRNSDQLVLTPCMYQLQGRTFENENGEPLSDHLPLMVQFQWQVRDSSYSIAAAQ